MSQEEERDKKKTKHEVHGRCISVNEMLHQMLKYPDIFCDLIFIKIPTKALEFRAGIKLGLQRAREKKTSATNNASGEEQQNNSGEVELPFILSLRRDLFDEENDEENWRCASDYQRVILSDIKLLSSTKVDRVTQFSLRPPELRHICDKLGNYFRWFHVSETCLKESEITELLSEEVSSCGWVDLLHCQVKLRRKAIEELCSWIETIENEESVRTCIVDVIRRIKRVTNARIEELEEDDRDFMEFAEKHLLYDDSKDEHLPIPVFDFIKPTMGSEFLHHVLLSLGRFDTELDLVMHPSIKECMKYARLIGISDDPDVLEEYSKKLLKLFIQKQLCYYPNGQGVIDSWIIHCAELFDSVIIRGDIPVSDMPSVLISALFADHEEEIVKYKKKIREDMVEATFRELGDAVNRCSIPPKEQVLSATLDNPVEWDPIESFHFDENSQSRNSFEEQLIAIKTCVSQIDSYINLNTSGTYTKNVIVSGFPGGGKTFVMMYVGIYALCRGLNPISTAMMAHRAVQLGGVHWHKLLCIPTEDNMSIYRRAEVAIHKLSRNPKKMEFLKQVDIFLSDEKSQHSSEICQCIDIICRRSRGINLLNGGVLEIATMDHSQLQPIKGRPFLTNPNVISCYKLVALNYSVRACNDANFFRLQQISRYDYDRFDTEPELIDEFKNLCRGFTFVEK